MGPVQLDRYINRVSTEIWMKSFGLIFIFLRIFEVSRSNQIFGRQSKKKNNHEMHAKKSGPNGTDPGSYGLWICDQNLEKKKCALEIVQQAS
jgi:hypothetical protein